MKKYDLVVIGGGPAGTPVAIEFAKLNPDKKVALIDKKGELGGECLFDGCIPSKIMKMSAKLIKELVTLKDFGIALDSMHYNLVWEKIVQRKKNILAKRTQGAKKNISAFSNVDILKATAKFVDEKEILVNYEDNVQEQLLFQYCVIATGSKSFIPHYKGNGIDKVWTNEDFFERMELPKTMSIIGDGAIAIEFAQILSTLGVKINLICRRAYILKNVDKDFSNIIFKEIQANKNINFLLNAEVKEINYDDKFKLTYNQNGEIQKCESQRVLIATGRVANTFNLDLEKAKVAYSEKGITTDKHLATTNKYIYANGDVVAGYPKFAHTAMYGAHTIAQNLFLEHNLFSIDYAKNSWILFSSPNIAVAGINEDEAKAKGLDVIIGVYDYAIDARFQIEDEKVGYLKFIVERSSKKILGVSAVLNEASSIIGEGALIVAKGLTLSDIIATIHPHPTFSESFSFLAKQMMGEIMLKKLENPAVKILLKVERFL